MNTTKSNLVKESVAAFLQRPFPIYVKDLFALREQIQSHQNDDRINAEKILLTMCTFGINPKMPANPMLPVTNKQFARLQSTFDKCYPKVLLKRQNYPSSTSSTSSSTSSTSISNSTILTETPTLIINTNECVRLSQLTAEAAVLVMTLIEALSTADLASGLTMPIIDYYAMLDIISAEYPALRSQLAVIDKILKAYGWTSSGFESAPNSSEIINLIKESVKE